MPRPARRPEARPGASGTTPAPPRPGRPLLLLPGAGPGGAPLRLRLRPGRLLLLLAASLVGAAAAGLAAGLLLSRPGLLLRLREENAGLRATVDALSARLSGLEAVALRGATPGQEAPPLRMPSSVRVAIARGEGALTVSGTSLTLPSGSGAGSRTGAVVVERRGKELAVRGGGPLPEGAEVRATGRLRVGEREAPGAVRLYPEGERGVLAVAEIDLERYVAGVLSGELPQGWEPEALRAQAVAARTYALWRRAAAEGPYDLEVTTADQVLAAGEPDPAAVEAARATRGEVLLEGGRPAATYFHAACGGRTEAAKAVWPEREAPPYPPVLCGRCVRSPLASWTARLGAAELAAALPDAGGRLTAFEIASRTATGRVAEVRVETARGLLRIPGNELRRLLGYGRLRSTWFTVAPEGGGWILEGRGAGHGVGLCQWGAQGLAREGLDYVGILAVYYPGLELRRLE